MLTVTSDEADQERKRLRQLAETAGSLAPRNMRGAIVRDTPPTARPWSTIGRSERVALVMIVVLVTSVTAVGAVMVSHGYGLVVGLFVAFVVAIMVCAKISAPRYWRDHG